MPCWIVVRYKIINFCIIFSSTEYKKIIYRVYFICDGASKYGFLVCIIFGSCILGLEFCREVVFCYSGTMYVSSIGDFVNLAYISVSICGLRYIFIVFERVSRDVGLCCSHCEICNVGIYIILSFDLLQIVYIFNICITSYCACIVP